jgi:hypothetical protein
MWLPLLIRLVIRSTVPSKNMFQMCKDKDESERGNCDVTVLSFLISHCLCLQLTPSSMDVRYEEGIIWSEKMAEGLTLMNMRNFHPVTSQHLARRLDI